MLNIICLKFSWMFNCVYAIMVIGSKAKFNKNKK